MGKLYKTFTDVNAKVVGFFPIEGYKYDFSLAQHGDKFCGLVIDQHNEKAKTDERIEKWIDILKDELNL